MSAIIRFPPISQNLFEPRKFKTPPVRTHRLLAGHLPHIFSLLEHRRDCRRGASSQRFCRYLPSSFRRYLWLQSSCGWARSPWHRNWNLVATRRRQSAQTLPRSITGAPPAAWCWIPHCPLRMRPPVSTLRPLATSMSSDSWAGRPRYLLAFPTSGVRAKAW